MISAEIPIFSPSVYAKELSPGSLDWEGYFHSTYMVFHINTMEEYVKQSQLKDLPLPPHRKAVYDFIFLTNGEMIRSKSLDSYLFSKNTFFFLPASQITTLKSVSPDTHGYYCHFNIDIFNKSLSPKGITTLFPFLNHIGNPIVKIDDGAVDFILQIFGRLEKEYRSPVCNLDFVASCMLTLLHEVNHFIDVATNVTENSASRIAERYKNALMQHIQENQKITYYANLLAVTPEYLNRCVKSTFGKTSHDLLDEMIILEAKVLLKQSPLNISEIAFKIGKRNPSDFIRFFKTKTGITPKEYRIQI